MKRRLFPFGWLLTIWMLLATTGLAKAHTVDTVVGAIPGSGGPGGLGGASYSIPITVPEGLGGLKPGIGVVYNSQGGNGLLGWCWDLQGISMVSRAGTTVYHDGRMSGVDFVDDHFALDGQRLVCIARVYGADSAEYRTEMDGMARIVSYTCDTTNGPACFKVWYPGGNIASYGYTWDSRIGLQQHHDVCQWMLNRVEDRDGNYMTYHYNRGGASCTLSEIRYGGNSRADIECRAISGAAIGGVSGIANGIVESRANNVDFWTGKTSQSNPSSLTTQSATNTKANQMEAQSPVQKGKAGVEKASLELEAEGYTLLSHEITVEVNGVRIRLDIAMYKDGNVYLVEVKNGPHAGFTPNQKAAYPQMTDSPNILKAPIIPKGYNASQIPQFNVG